MQQARDEELYLLPLPDELLAITLQIRFFITSRLNSSMHRVDLRHLWSALELEDVLAAHERRISCIWQSSI
jgi:hypothetical protein